MVPWPHWHHPLAPEESDGLEWKGTSLPTAAPRTGHYVSRRIAMGRVEGVEPGRKSDIGTITLYNVYIYIYMYDLYVYVDIFIYIYIIHILQYTIHIV